MWPNQEFQVNFEYVDKSEMLSPPCLNSIHVQSIFNSVGWAELALIRTFGSDYMTVQYRHARSTVTVL